MSLKPGDKGGEFDIFFTANFVLYNTLAEGPGVDRGKKC